MFLMQVDLVNIQNALLSVKGLDKMMLLISLCIFQRLNSYEKENYEKY